MAIQFYKTEKTSSWLNILFYISLILLIAVVSGYFILNSFQKKTEANIKELDSQLAGTKTSGEISLEYYQNKIDDFAYLFDKYIVNSNFFGFIEKDTFPKVWFNKVDIISTENKVQLSGSSDSFQSLDQQILIFKKDSLVQQVDLSTIAFGKEGEINFGLNLLLDPKVFQK